MAGGWRPPRHGRPRGLALTLVALTMSAAFVTLGAPPVAADVTDDAVVHVTPYPLPEVANARRAQVAPITGADGVDYYLWEIRLVQRSSGEWRDEPLTPSDVSVTVRNGNGTSRGTWSGPDAFAFAGDDHRVLVSVPAAAARPADDSLVTVVASAKGREGAFNMLKSDVPPRLGDALDVVPTSVRLLPQSEGTFAFSVTLTITPTSASSYEVGLEALSPIVEPTTLTTQHGSRSVTVDRSTPVRESFTGDPVGVVATSTATRFSFADKATFGDPVARFLLCLTGVACQLSVTEVLTLQNVTADAGASESPPGEALTYEWEWGDGDEATGRKVQHEWTRRGLYPVNLTVWDESGRSDIVTLVMRVLNRDPKGYVAIDPTPVTRAGNTSFIAVAQDLDGDIVSHTWYLNGMKPPVRADRYILDVPGHELTLGGHEVSVLIVDDAGGAAILTRSFEVVNVPPTALGLANRTHVPTGQPVKFTDLSLDPDGDAFSWNWDFGDGTGSAERNPVHAYATAGVYTPSLTVLDREFAKSTVALAPITVDGTLPTLTVTGPATPGSGWFTSPARLTVHATDDVTSNPPIRYHLNGGSPRSIVTGTAFAVGAEGQNTVLVTATDEAGNVARVTRVVPVDQVPPSFDFEPPWPIATGYERLIVHAEDQASGVARITLVLDQSETLAVHEGPGPLDYRWDTSTVLPGRHVLTVHVDDEAGHRTTRGFNVIAVGVKGVHLGGILP